MHTTTKRERWKSTKQTERGKARGKVEVISGRHKSAKTHNKERKTRRREPGKLCCSAASSLSLSLSLSLSFSGNSRGKRLRCKLSLFFLLLLACSNINKCCHFLFYFLPLGFLRFMLFFIFAYFLFFLATCAWALRSWLRLKIHAAQTKLCIRPLAHRPPPERKQKAESFGRQQQQRARANFHANGSSAVQQK